MKRSLKIVSAITLLLLAFVHWILPDIVEGQRNRIEPHASYPVHQEGRALHESLFVADLHTESLLWKRNLLRRSSVGHVDLPRLRDGNVALQVFSATTQVPAGQNYLENESDSDDLTLLAIASFWPYATWDSIYERAVYQLQKLDRLTEKSELQLLTSRQSMQDFVIRRAAGEPAIGALYLIEGAHPLEGQIENLDRLYDAGLRIVGLTHFFDNEIGGSLHGVSGSGLTDFGRLVVRRANELGLIIDIAHASPATVRDVLAMSQSPAILSHGGLKGQCDTARNLDDALMQEFAAKGGLIGIGFWDAAVCDPSPAGIAAAIRYAINLLGVEHVALGSDYDGTVTVSFDVSDLEVLTQAMLDADFSEQEIRLVMGENVKRFLLQNLPDSERSVR